MRPAAADARRVRYSSRSVRGLGTGTTWHTHTGGLGALLSITSAALETNRFASGRPRHGGCHVSIHNTMPTLTLGRRKRRHAVGFSAKYSIRSRMPERLEETSTHSALDIGTATDVGRVRAANEDSLLALLADGPREGQVLVAVADGMGGHKAGEVASALAIEALRRALGETDPAARPDELLSSAVQLGNRTIWDAAGEDADKEGMGTTLVCALLGADGEAMIANVGDSRAYAYSAGETMLVTVDHTSVSQQVMSDQLCDREARFSPFRNLLTRTLGNAPRVDVDLFTGVRLEAGDALILVSDGVTGYLDEGDFSAVMDAAASAQAAAERLVEEAVARGGADNATAVVVRRR